MILISNSRITKILSQLYYHKTKMVNIVIIRLISTIDYAKQKRSIYGGILILI